MSPCTPGTSREGVWRRSSFDVHKRLRKEAHLNAHARAAAWRVTSISHGRRDVGDDAGYDVVVTWWRRSGRHVKCLPADCLQRVESTASRRARQYVHIIISISIIYCTENNSSMMKIKRCRAGRDSESCPRVQSCNKSSRKIWAQNTTLPITWQKERLPLSSSSSSSSAAAAAVLLIPPIVGQSVFKPKML